MNKKKLFHALVCGITTLAIASQSPSAFASYQKKQATPIPPIVYNMDLQNINKKVNDDAVNTEGKIKYTIESTDASFYPSMSPMYNGSCPKSVVVRDLSDPFLYVGDKIDVTGMKYDEVTLPCPDVTGGGKARLYYNDTDKNRQILDDYDEAKVTPDFSTLKVEAVNLDNNKSIELKEGKGYKLTKENGQFTVNLTESIFDYDLTKDGIQDEYSIARMINDDSAKGALRKLSDEWIKENPSSECVISPRPGGGGGTSDPYPYPYPGGNSGSGTEVTYAPGADPLLDPNFNPLAGNFAPTTTTPGSKGVPVMEEDYDQTCQKQAPTWPSKEETRSKFAYRITYDAKVNDNVVKEGRTTDINNELKSNTATENGGRFTIDKVTTKVGKLQANKVDEKTRTPLEGAEFELYQCVLGQDKILPDAKPLTIGGKNKFLSDKDGNVSINAVRSPYFENNEYKDPTFDYCLKEVKSPEGYSLPENPFRIAYAAQEATPIANRVLEEKTPNTETPTPQTSESETPNTSENETPKTSESETPAPTTTTDKSETPTPTPTTDKDDTPTTTTTTPTKSSDTVTPTESTTNTTSTKEPTPTTNTAPTTVMRDGKPVVRQDTVPAPAKKNPEVNTGGHAEKVSILDKIKSIFK